MSICWWESKELKQTNMTGKWRSHLVFVLFPDSSVTAVCSYVPIPWALVSLPFLSFLIPSFLSLTSAVWQLADSVVSGCCDTWPQLTPPGITSSPLPYSQIDCIHWPFWTLFVLQISDALPLWPVRRPACCTLCLEYSVHVPLNVTISLFFRSQLSCDFLQKASWLSHLVIPQDGEFCVVTAYLLIGLLWVSKLCVTDHSLSI